MGGDTVESTGNNFPVFILIFAGVFHIMLICIVCYYACCRSKIQRRNRSELDAYRPGRRNSLRYNNTSYPNQNNDDDQTAEEAWSSPQCQDASSNLQPISNWQTSLLARVRQHLRLSPQPPRTPPPAYRTTDSSDDGGIVNQAVVLDGAHALPSYGEYIARLPSWYSDDSLDFDCDKPPAYEEVVSEKKQSDH